MTEPQQLHLTLDPNGVAAPAQRIVIIASNVVATALRALSNDNLAPPEMQASFMGYSFSGIEWTDAERRQTFENWILSKGFQDLARGIRETLEEASFYLDLIEMKAGLTTVNKFEAKLAAARASASKRSFPQLLEIVNDRLKEPIAFDAEFLSLQRARNCLEHRGGRVGPKDIDTSTGMMTLSFPRLRIFYLRGSEEIEVIPGEVIDTQAPDNPLRDEDGMVNIFMNRVTRSRDYSLGEPLIITASDFFEIAMACNMFAADIAAKLPTLAPISEPAK